MNALAGRGPIKPDKAFVPGPAGTPRRQKPKVLYKTGLGKMVTGLIEDVLVSEHLSRVKGKVNLIFTSPPFPLVFKKKYGNRTGEEYLAWLRQLAPLLTELLAPDGSIVVEIGNAWNSGDPTMSTLPLRALLAFQEAGRLYLCQHLVCHNPARLPSPAQWVTVERIRLKDSFTHVWWMAPSKRPNADNRRVLTPYGADMLKLLRTKSYNGGRRPSGHVISEEGFLKNHGGAIAPNALEIDDPARLPESFLKISNTAWDAKYVKYCRAKALMAHPARMRPELAMFFVEFLTRKQDLILDPFAGSNTTGRVAEVLDRQWISVEANHEYAQGSRGRFAKR